MKTSLKAHDRTKISPLRGTYRSKLAIGPKCRRYTALLSNSMLPCGLTHVWLFIHATLVARVTYYVLNIGHSTLFASCSVHNKWSIGCQLCTIHIAEGQRCCWLFVIMCCVWVQGPLGDGSL